MQKFTRWLLLIVIGVFALAACGSAEPEAAAPPAPTDPPPTAVPAEAAVVEEVVAPRGNDEPFPEPNVSLIGATGNVQVLNVYANW